MAEKTHPPPLTPVLQERASAELYELNKKLQKQLKQDINRQVYNQNVIKHKEDAVVEQIRKVKGRKRGGVQETPDSDVFLTPKDSPGEAPDTYRGGTCNFPKSAQPSVDRRKNSLYYNLVHLEEDFNSPSSGGSTNNLLEKELAEQDQLFQSFHSIIIKEGQEDKKKTTPPPEQPPPQPVKKKKVAIVKPVKKVVKPKIFTKPIKNEYIDCGFDSEYLNLEGDYKRKGMNYGGKGEESMSGRHQDSRDSPVGPSSGASSPSVTWDSVMQDPPIPHQCILSPGDSPSASHPTTYYSSPEPLSKQLTSPSPPKSPSNPLQEKHPSPSEQEKIVTYDRAVSPVNFLDKISPSFGVMSPEQSNRSSVVDDSFPLLGSLPVSPVSQSPIILRAEVSPPQVKTAPCPTNLYSQPDSQMLNQDLKTETLCTVKTNYFIDASNLTDEAEGDLINNLSVAYITRSAIDFVEPKLVTKETDDPTYSKELDNLTLCNTVKNSCEIINKDCQNNISISSDQIFDNPLKSLVRHNTFEVETTVCKTHVIINNVNDLSASSNFNHDMYPKTDVVKCMNINTFQTCDVGVQNNQTLFMPLSESKHAQTDEEGQSPDSLTNDYVKADGVESTITPENSVKAVVNDSVQTELVLSSISDKTLNSSIHEPSVSDLIDISSSSNCESVVDVTKLIETANIPDQRGSVDLSEPISQTTRERMCSGSDGSWGQSEHVESPRVRRKTEEAPILSGAATFTPEVEEKPIIKPKLLNTMTTSWTIDMSDTIVSGSENDKRKPERVKSVTSSFGFFVPLSNEPPQACEIDSTQKKIKEPRKSVNEEDTANSSQGSSCGFYIDLRNDFESLDSQISVQSGENESFKPEKKLFSMFIDISDSCSKSSDSASPKSKTSSPFLPTRKARVKNQSVSRCEDPPTSLSSDSGLDMGVGEHPEIVRGKSLFGSTAANTSTSSSSETSKKQSFYMFIEANETKPPNRRKNIPLGLSQSSNRLSWTSENGQSLVEPGSQSKNGQVYKRTHSLNEKSNNVPVEETGMSGPASLDTACVQKTSNSSNGSSNRMMSSWHGVVKPSSELSKIIKNSKSKDSSQKDNLSNSISEKCDKEDISSSVKSDDVFDSNASVSSKDENRTFVLDDVSKVAQANSSELEASTTSSHDIVSDLSKDDSETDKIQEASVCSNKTQKSERFSFEADYPPNQANEDTFEQRHRIADDDGYVKLSDMDRIMPNYSRENRKNSRMTRSIPEGSTVFENKILTKSSTSRSLSRLFPHLSSQFQVEPDDLPSNNSLQSSFNPSLEASAEGFVGECSRLGEDLLRMFLEEISPDVVVEVGGRRIKAHKCILSSRCQYFAAMLSGGWVESAGNVISLPGFSYNTVHFALCHIYSGASNVPESINIVELATLADMLCLEGLKEVITYTLKVKYCHFFHKPCSECIVGCVECLPVAAAYGLDEIYRKSLRWISKHFTRVWPTKSFASLPKELHDKCYKQHIVHMNAENILETIMGCEKLEATIPNVRWAQTIFSLNTKLQDTSHKYLTNHFKEVLSSNAFLSLSREDSWTIGRIEDVLLTLADLIQPDQAVHSYGKLHAMVAAITPQTDFKMEFLNLLKKLENRVEDCLIKQAGRAIRTPAWTKLDPSLRKKIQEAACLVFTPGDGKRTSVLNMHQRNLSKTELAGVANSLERKRALLAKSRPTSSKSVPPPNKSKPVVPQSKTVSTKSSSVVGSRLANSKIPSASNVSKPSPRSSAPCQPPAVRQAKSQTTTSSSATPSPLLKSRNNRFAQVKSRYMDPKPDRKESTDSVGRESRSSTRTTTTRNSRNVGSSSDSSRTASPACMRHPHAMSTDSLEAATQPAPSRVSSAPPPRLNKSSLTQARPRTKPSVGPRSSTFTKPSTK